MSTEPSATRVAVLTSNTELASALREPLERRKFLVDFVEPGCVQEYAGHPHVLVVDAEGYTPKRLAALRRRFDASRIMALSSPDEGLLLQGFALGIVGWMMSWEPPQTLEDAIALLAAGGAAMSLAVFGALLRAAGLQGTAGLGAGARAGLSLRQTEVLQLVARGLTDREIADRLTISTRTVNRHVSDILRALGASNRREAAEMILGEPPPAVVLRPLGDS